MLPSSAPFSFRVPYTLPKEPAEGERGGSICSPLLEQLPSAWVSWNPGLQNWETESDGVCRLAAGLKQLQKPLHQPTGPVFPPHSSAARTWHPVQAGESAPPPSTCGKEPPWGTCSISDFPSCKRATSSKTSLLRDSTAQRWKATAHSDGSTRFVEPRTPIPDPPFPPVTIVCLSFTA